MIRTALKRWATSRPYFHLDGYMRRYWILGADSVCRNLDNPTLRYADLVRQTSRSSAYQSLTAWIVIRLHEILRSDNDHHLHDHPCWNISIVLWGGYWERMPLFVVPSPEHFIADCEYTVKKWRGPGSIVFRRATDRHSLELPAGQTCWSIFIMGKKSQSWGFYTPAGKVGWREYLGVQA